jgi:hypothetical protein
LHLIEPVAMKINQKRPQVKIVFKKKINFMIHTMIHLSKWARIHVWKARIVIAVCYTLLFAIAQNCGRLLYGNHIIMPESWVYASLGVASALYISVKLMHGRTYILKRFVFQKLSCMAILSASLFGMLVIFSQPPGTFPVQENKAYGLIVKEAQAKPDALALLSAKAAQARELSKGWKIALIILTIIGVVFLELVIAAVACVIACAGSGILAIAVFAGGTTGVVFLTISLIRTILGKKRRRQRY